MLIHSKLAVVYRYIHLCTGFPIIYFTTVCCIIMLAIFHVSDVSSIYLLSSFYGYRIYDKTI